MPHVSLRVSEEEKRWMEGYAKVQGVNLSDAVKDAFFEKLEDEYDLRMIREHEAEKAKGNMKYYTHDEIMREFRLR
ncbi:MAG: DUF6290 family protein [Dehalococcoidia bacterium]|nr:DUF6290 family protein [Dehalococcoidia bacterium]